MPNGMPAEIKEAARIARALSHPVRLQILNELRDGGAYVMHLTTMLGRPQANISQHLMVLREADLVIAEREGMTVIYHVRNPRVLDVVDQLLALAGERPEIRRTDDVMPGADGSNGMRGKRQRRRKGKCRCPRCRGEE
jgi:ArsR family transcriptional regulator